MPAPKTKGNMHTPNRNFLRKTKGRALQAYQQQPAGQETSGGNAGPSFGCPAGRPSPCSGGQTPHQPGVQNRNTLTLGTLGLHLDYKKKFKENEEDYTFKFYMVNHFTYCTICK